MSSNTAQKKAAVQAELIAARSAGDILRVQQLSDVLEQVSVGLRLNEIKTFLVRQLDAHTKAAIAHGGNSASVGNINERNRKKNFARSLELHELVIFF